MYYALYCKLCLVLLRYQVSTFCIFKVISILCIFGTTYIIIVLLYKLTSKFEHHSNIQFWNTKSLMSWLDFVDFMSLANDYLIM